MYTPIDQNAVGQKIHQFMARKSPGRTFSTSVAERLSPSLTSKHRAGSGISYERLEWHQHDIAHAKLQKAH